MNVCSIRVQSISKNYFSEEMKFLSDPSELISAIDQRAEFIAKFFLNYGIVYCIINVILIVVSLTYCLLVFGHADTEHLFFTYRLMWVRFI